MIFECENVTLGYEDKIVTSNVSFTIDKGDYVCIVGENGTGKSTFLFNEIKEKILKEIMCQRE